MDAGDEDLPEGGDSSETDGTVGTDASADGGSAVPQLGGGVGVNVPDGVNVGGSVSVDGKDASRLVTFE